MVADIRLLQGKIIQDLDQNPKNFTQLIEELALEILADAESPAPVPTSHESQDVRSIG